MAYVTVGREQDMHPKEKRFLEEAKGCLWLLRDSSLFLQGVKFNQQRRHKGKNSMSGGGGSTLPISQFTQGESGRHLS